MQSSLRFSGVIDASYQSVPLCVLLFDLTEKHVQGVSLAPEMLTSTRIVTGTLEDSSC